MKLNFFWHILNEAQIRIILSSCVYLYLCGIYEDAYMEQTQEHFYWLPKNRVVPNHSRTANRNTALVINLTRPQNTLDEMALL